MKKRTLFASVVVFCGLLAIPFLNNSKEAPKAEASVESHVPTVQTVESEMLRSKEYDNLAELKKDAQHVVIASFVEKKAPIPDGGGNLYRTENVFHVETVLKSDPSLANTE